MCIRDSIGETEDLAQQEPARVAEMQSRFERWSEQLATPRWSYGRKKASKR